MNPMRRRFQFSLAGLLWFMFVIAVNVITWQAFWLNVVATPEEPVGLPAWFGMGGYDSEILADGRRIQLKQPPPLIEIPAGEGEPARFLRPTRRE
jgi:hypothetical protein